MNDYRKLTIAEAAVLLICGVLLAALVASVMACSSAPKCVEGCTCNKLGEIEWCPYMDELLDHKKVKWQ